MLWISAMQAAVEARMSAAESERRYTSTLSPAERKEYYAQKDAQRAAREEQEKKEAEAAALKAEQEEIANRTYRNPESDYYDPLRVLEEKRTTASGSASTSSA